MPEWMAHHQRLGVGRFYIFDNGSDPPLNTTFTEHIASGLIKCEANHSRLLHCTSWSELCCHPGVCDLCWQHEVIRDAPGDPTAVVLK